ERHFPHRKVAVEMAPAPACAVAPGQGGESTPLLEPPPADERGNRDPGQDGARRRADLDPGGVVAVREVVDGGVARAGVTAVLAQMGEHLAPGERPGPR